MHRIFAPTALLALAALLALPALPAFAQTQPAMPGMEMSAASSPSTVEFQAAMGRMDKAMAIPYTGDADQDFVAGMLPHHQGAVDMAKIELQHGRHPALKKLARDIIAAQDKEIAFMKAWQAAHPIAAK